MTQPVQYRADPPRGALPDGLFRIEDSDVSAGLPDGYQAPPAAYSHDEIYGQYVTIHGFIDAPPDEVYQYLADTRSLAEWTYSMRGFRRTTEPDVWVSDDLIGEETRIFTRTDANPEARTVDYHCAWDQGHHLWMIYLIRVIDAQVVLNRPGTVIVWTNCRHPFYAENPFPEAAPPARKAWVGDYWDVFAPGHRGELANLTAICEARHRAGEPVRPAWMDES